MAVAAESSMAALAGRYLTFGLSSEQYGLEILRVREIIGLMDIRPVPRTPEFVRGVINLRGSVIPVIDLRLKFGMSAAESTPETCIIVVNVEALELGIVVDRVSEVLDIAAGEIEAPPSFGAAVCTDYLLGLAKTGGHVTALLDISRVLGGQELAKAASAEAAA